jgi:PAS domain S-box-containing protein
MFSIIIACGIFIVAWNSRRFLDNMYLLFIGIAYLFIGGLDLMHTLSYKGMGVFQGYDANLPTQFWISARYLESFSLLIAPLIVGRQLKINVQLFSYAAAVSLLLGSIFYWEVFPACFVEGIGLTPFKKISEYVISLILFGSIAVLWKRRSEFEEDVVRLLIASIVLTIASELAFTFYVRVYGISNLIGHFLKIISFYLIYKAIIVTGLNRPYDLLFRNLKQNREALLGAHDKLERQVQIRTSQLEEAIYLLKLDENKLQESRKRLKRAQRIARLGFLDWDLKTNQIHWSEEIYNIFGVNRTEKTQTIESTVALVHPSDLEFVKKNMDDAIKGTKEYNIEHRMLRPDGRVVWVHARAELIRGPDGNPKCLLGTVIDISERRQAEEVLQQSEEKYRGIFDESIAAIYVFDEKKHFIDSNQAGLDLLGYSRDELLSMSIPDIDADPVVVQPVHKQLLSGENIVNYEHQLRRKDGIIITVLNNSRPLRGVEGNIIGMQSTLIDITMQKQVSEELLNSQKDLQKLAGRLISKQEKELQGLARELHDDLTQQLAVMAIDTGNIIQQVKDLPPSVLSTISYIKDSLIKVSKDVHRMSRDLHPSILEDLGLLRAVKSECSNFSSRMGIAVMFTPKNMPDTVPNNTALTIYRIIQEGLSNIAKYANTKKAYVFLESNDSSILLTIRDTGTGFNPAKVRHKAALGLGSMRERARLVNGEFSITSRPGKGTSIEVKIPLKGD